MSFLAWIDFDQADRDRTRRIMDLFGQEDSRDELGLGSVRDALADLMFPGTSTIQTRLRYMLFVPWIYQMAGTQKGTAQRTPRARPRAGDTTYRNPVTRWRNAECHRQRRQAKPEASAQRRLLGRSPHPWHPPLSGQS